MTKHFEHEAPTTQGVLLAIGRFSIGRVVKLLLPKECLNWTGGRDMPTLIPNGSII